MEVTYQDKLVFSGAQYEPFFKYWSKYREELIREFKLEPRKYFGEHRLIQDEIKGNVPGEVAQIITRLSKGNEMAGFTCLLSALFVVLYRYTGEDTVVVSTPLCLSTDKVKYNSEVPFCMHMNGGITIRELLNKTKSLLTDAYEYQNFPLSLIDPNIKEDSCITNVMLRHAQLHESIPHPEKFDLIIIVDDLLNKPQIGCRFNDAKFSLAVINNLLVHLLRTIGELDNLNTSPGKLDYLGKDEKHFLLYEVNDTQAPFPESSTLIDLFEAQAGAAPDAIAVRFENKSVSYVELKDHVDRIAEFLITRYQVVVGERIALCMERSEKMVAVLLAIFRCGAAYVPIDPDLPYHRLNYIVEDAGARVVITDAILIGRLPEGPVVLSLNESWNDIMQLSGDYPFSMPNPDSIAYVIYTSGSTGMPKGVVMPHKGVVNRIHWMWKQYGFSAADVILQKTSYMFDVSVWEFFMPLCFGATMIACRREVVNDPGLIRRHIYEYGITALHFVPGMLQPFLQSITAHDTALLSSLRMVFCSGEALLPAVVNLFYQKLSVPLHNLYGPTEAAVDVSFYEARRGDHIVPIGKPIDNIQLYILDRQLYPSPVGVAGELAIGGIGLAEGYLHRPELTAERFVENPFASGGKLYMTGDICYRLENGNIVYLNRKDDQVKVRGFRIELGEIESWMLRYPYVKKAAVLSRKDKQGDNTLYGYVEGDLGLDIDGLYKFLREHLPGYMIPPDIRQLDRFPMTTSGKTDRKSLPLPGERAKGDRGLSDIPFSSTEKELALIWEEVLSASNVGREDDFARLGGDSIKAIRLVLAINARLKCGLEVGDVFRHPVLSDLAAFIEKNGNSTARGGSDKAKAWIDAACAKALERGLAERFPKGWEDCYPMSDIQLGMVFHNITGDRKMFYHEQLYSQIVDDAFDVPAFGKAFSLLVNKHEILRTSFHIEDLDVPVLVVHKAETLDYDIEYEDLTALSSEKQQRHVRDFMELDRGNPFTITVPCLWRMRVYRLSEAVYGILFIFHHGILDGWSNASLMTELSNVYSTCRKNEDPGKLQPLASRYRDFIADQFDIKNDESYTTYWRGRLAGYERTPLPLKGYEAYHRNDYRVRRFRSFIDIGTAFNIENGTFPVSMRELMLSAFYYLIWATTNAPEITIGVVTHARPEIPDGDKVLGCFLNTVPFHLSFSKKMTCNDLVKEVVEKSRELKGYDKLPLKKIARLYGDEQENPFFDILFNYVDFHIYDQISKDITEDLPLIESYESTNTYLDFTIEKKGELVNIVVTYSDGIYTEEEVSRMVTYFRNILEFMGRHPDEPLSSESILPEEERADLLGKISGKSCIYPVSSTMARVFETQVSAAPDAIALVLEDEYLTYHELNERANRLANYLLERFNPQPDEPIALMSDPSVNAIISILAILKTGAPYLPLDPKYPQERVSFILEQAGAGVLLVEKPVSLIIPAQVNVVNVCSIGDKLNSSSCCNPDKSVDASSLAYIIYTSGSTGVPKGVMVENRSIINTAFAWVDEGDIVRGDKVLQFSSLSFDASCEEIFSAFAAGASLILIKREVINDPELFLDYIEQKGVTLVTLPPTYLNTLDFRRLSGKRVQSAGEAINISDSRKLVAYTTLYNGYGPTECTVATAVYRVKGTEPIIPIGKPMPNSKMYILNNDLQLLPVGVKGQICVGGIGVSRGYLHNSSLTANRFVLHPLTNERIYLTGDIGVYNAEGYIIFLGRNDDQIKINGYRIEISEIESVLIRHENISHVKIDVWEQNNRKDLIAYLIAVDNMTEHNVKDYLSHFLPPYMIPQHFLFIEAFPYTINGKIDLKALRRLYLEFREQRIEMASDTATETELMLKRRWEEIFGRKDIGFNDSFFSLGGDSIKAIQLVALLRKEGLNLTAKHIFHNPTISMLAPLITKQMKAASQELVSGPVHLTPMQLRFLRNPGEEELSFNFSFLLTAKESLDAGLIKLAFEKLMDHHDALRIRYRNGINGVEQYNEEGDCQLDLPCYTVDGGENPMKEVYKRAMELHNSLGVHDWPLLRPALFIAGKSQHLLVTISHLVIDVVSWRILLEDLTALYRQLKKGDALRLPLKTASFKDWSGSLSAYSRSQELLQEFAYWKEICLADTERIARDFQDEVRTGFPTEKVSLTLAAERTSFLLSGSPDEQKAEPVDLLLAALGLSAYKVFQTGSLMVEMEGHGRTYAPEDIDIVRTVGWFTNTYPLLIQVNRPTDLGHEVNRISAARKTVPMNGIGYNILRYLSQNEDITSALDVPFQITFNYLGTFKSAYEETLFSIDYGFDAKPSLKAFQTGAKDFDIIAVITDGVLQLDICYDSGHFARQSMEHWITAYQDTLEQLVDYYMDADTRGLNPGRPGYNNISPDAFERISKLFS